MKINACEEWNTELKEIIWFVKLNMTLVVLFHSISSILLPFLYKWFVPFSWECTYSGYEALLQFKQSFCRGHVTCDILSGNHNGHYENNYTNTYFNLAYSYFHFTCCNFHKASKLLWLLHALSLVDQTNV